jgi:hypothetical protein
MSGISWLPGKREDRLAMAKLWFAVLSETRPTPDGGSQTNAAAWNIPEELTMELGALIGACDDLLAKTKDPETATKVTRAKCRSAFKQLKKKMQELRKYFYLDKFPKEDLSRLNLVSHKMENTPTPKPTQYVSFEIIVYVKDHRVVIEYRIAGGTSKSKRPYHAAELRLWILPLDAPGPVTADDPGWQSFANTATPWERTFKAEDIGKRLHIAMRWENLSTGKDGDENAGKGPWSAIQSVIIP